MRGGGTVNECQTLDRRTEFLEVSSPFALLMKAMWERSDPALQKLDQADIAWLSVGSSTISLAGIKPQGAIQQS